MFNPKMGRELANYVSLKDGALKRLSANRLYAFLVSIGLGPDETKANATIQPQ